jgi:RNA polymerase sigma factor (sigma-70 family)
MLNLFNKADITAPIENLSAYIYQALRNRVTDMLRKKKETASLREFVQPLKDDTAQTIEQKELKAKVFDAIDNLNDDQRAVVIATEFENRSFRELSEEWRIPLGTLLARKSRALQKIKKELTGLV